jgi:hypothetical protein
MPVQPAQPDQDAVDLVEAIDAALARYPAEAWKALSHRQQAAAIDAELQRIKLERGKTA